MVQSLVYTEHEGARRFLAVAQATLERKESQNGLILGVALRLVSEPRAYGGDPYLATIESASGLLAAAVMTPPHPLQLFAKEDRNPEALERVARGLLQGKWPVPGVLAREPLAEAFAAIWREKTGEDWRTGMRQTVYELRRVVHPPYPPGEFRAAIPEDLELVRRWARGFHEDCFGAGQHERPVASAEERVRKGELFLWVDGVPRSMAARTRPTWHGEAVGFVYTPPSERRKGFAAAVVARLSQRILDDGKEFWTLFANAANPTSNGIYQRIGYRAIGRVVDLHFSCRAEDRSAGTAG